MIKYTPYDYQKEIIDFGSSQNRTLQLIGMGLGKTISNLAILDNKFAMNETRGALIIAPLNVAQLTWQIEPKKWDISEYMEIFNMRDILLKATTKKAQKLQAEAWYKFNNHQYQLYIINYDIIPKLVNLILDRQKKVPFDYLILDESTLIKRYNGVWMEGSYKKTESGGRKKVSAGLRELLGIFPNRHLLTGTIIPNSYIDLFAQVRVLDGGKALGYNITQFRRQFCEKSEYCAHSWKIKGQHDLDEQLKNKRLRRRYSEALISSARQRVEEVHRDIEKRISHLTIVKRTEDYLDLPEIQIEDHYVKLTGEARKFYKEMEKDFLVQIEKYKEELKLLTDDDIIEASNPAVATGKLLQIASGNVYDTEEFEITEDGKKVITKGKSPQKIHNKKLEQLDKLINYYKKLKEPILIATNYQHEENDIANNYDCVVFNQGDKRKNQDDWNAGKIPIMVTNARAISHGLNLQESGHIIIWYSPTFDYDVWDQFNARLHRTGQTRGVIVHRILAEDTIDEAVIEVIRHRGNTLKGLQEALINLQVLKS